MKFKFVTQTEFRQELQRLTDKLKLSQEKVAELLDVAPRTTWRWFNGEQVRGFEREGILYVLRASVGWKSPAKRAKTPLGKKKLARARPAR